MKKIILIGMKASGKSTIGKKLAKNLKIKLFELDSEIEKNHFREKNERLWFREIFQKYGKEYFRSLETATLEKLAESLEKQSFVLTTGGGTPLKKKSQKILKKLGKIVFLDVSGEELLSRIIPGGIPAFFPYPDNPKKSLNELLKARRPIYKKVADITIQFNKESPKVLVDKIIAKSGGRTNEN